MRLIPFVPLAAVGVEIALLLVLFFGYLFMVGDMPPKQVPPEQERAREVLLDIICLILPVAGLVSGIGIMAMSMVHGPWPWVGLIVGCLGCGVFILSFGHDLLFPLPPGHY